MAYSTANAAKKPQPTPREPAAAHALPEAPTPPPRIKTLAEVSPEYARAAAKLESLNRELTAARSDLEQLQAELGTTETNPVRLEALELLGENTPGAAADLADKHTRAKAARNRVAVLTEAVRLLQPAFDAARSDAWRRLMQEATPEYRRLLVVHAKAVIEAARTKLDVRVYMEAIEAVSPPGRSGFADYSCGSISGDMRCHDSGVGRFLNDLISQGIISGDLATEPWLQDVAVIARRPDGTTVDRASPVPAFMVPAPAPAKGKSVLGAVVAGVRQGAAAVATAFTPAPRTGDVSPDDAPLPYPQAARVGSTGPAGQGATKVITLHRGLATSREEYPAGWCGPWPAADAANLVNRGYASWGALPASPPAKMADAPVSAAATLGS